MIIGDKNLLATATQLKIRPLSQLSIYKKSNTRLLVLSITYFSTRFALVRVLVGNYLFFI